MQVMPMYKDTFMTNLQHLKSSNKDLPPFSKIKTFLLLCGATLFPSHLGSCQGGMKCCLHTLPWVDSNIILSLPNLLLTKGMCNSR